MRKMSNSVLVRRIGGLCNLAIYSELPLDGSGSTVGVYGQARASSRPAPSSYATPLDDAVRAENRGLRHCQRMPWGCAGALPGGARGGNVAVGDVSLRCVDGLRAAGDFGEGGAVGGGGEGGGQRRRREWK